MISNFRVQNRSSKGHISSIKGIFSISSISSISSIGTDHVIPLYQLKFTNKGGIAASTRKIILITRQQLSWSLKLDRGTVQEEKYAEARWKLRKAAVQSAPSSRPDNRILLAPPPPVDSAEAFLPRAYCTTLSQLCSGHCPRLMFYKARVCWTDSDLCPDCGAANRSTPHLFCCLEHPTNLVTGYLWTAPLQVSQFLASLLAFSDLSPLRVLFPHQPP